MMATRSPYDTLILATGAFPMPLSAMTKWSRSRPAEERSRTPPTLRRRILVAFERAERETDPQRRAAPLTFVIIGAGPTGASNSPGPLLNSARDTLPPDFRNIDTQKARVVLIGGGPRVLAGLPTISRPMRSVRLEASASEVMLGQAVTECSADGVVYGGNR